MNLYQAGYYRLGTQGVNAGWQLVSASDGMSQKAKEGFQGIASTLIGMKNASLPILNMGVYKFDRFVYLLHMNYQASGEDARGVSYAHCYCFNQKDYLELSRNPEKLFGVQEEVFPNEYDGTIRAYPVVGELPYVSMSVDAIKAKYNITDEHYKEMVLAAISATEGLTPALCLKKDLPKEEYRQFYRDMLYLIDMALPYQLRARITAFSHGGVNDVVIYVSDQVSSTNYVDFDTNQYHLEYDRMKSYEFTMIYNSVPAIDRLSATWDQLSDWIQETMESSPKEGSCTQVEAAYQALFKKQSAAGIEPQKAVELIQAFLQYEPNDAAATYDYLATLLRLVNENQITIDDKKLNRAISSRYEQSNHEDYRVECDVLATTRLLAEEDRKAAFDSLYEMYKAHPTQYERVYQIILRKNPEMAVLFRLKKLLPEELTDFDIIKSHIAEVDADNSLSEAFKEQDLLVTLSCLKKVTGDRFQSARNFSDIQATEAPMQQILKELSGRSEKIEKNAITVGNQLYALLWTSFQTNWFDPSPEAIESYMSCELDYVSTLLDEPAGREAAQTVLNLIRLASGRFGQDSLRVLQSLVFANNMRVSPEKVQEIQMLVLNKYFETKQIDLFQHDFAFDTLLTLCYNPVYRKFDASYLGKLLDRYTAGKAFENKNVMHFVHFSKLIATQGYGDALLGALMDVAEQEEQYKASGVTPAVIKGLKKYQQVMEGKELKSEQMLDASNGFLTALYRGVMGIVVMAAFAITALNVKLNFDLPEEKTTLFFALTLAVFGLIYVGVLIMKMIMSGQITYIPEDAGLKTAATIVVYAVLMFVLILALILGALLFKSMAIVMWMLIGYLVISIVLMVISDLYLEAE